MRRVSSVGVRPTVNRRPRGRQVFTPSSLGDEARDGNDDNEDQDQAGNGDADGKVPLGKADGAGVVRPYLRSRIVHAIRRELVVVEVVGLADVEAAVDFDLQVLPIGVVEETFFIKLNGLPLFSS